MYQCGEAKLPKIVQDMYSCRSVTEEANSRSHQAPARKSRTREVHAIDLPILENRRKHLRRRTMENSFFHLRRVFFYFSAMIHINSARHSNRITEVESLVEYLT
jgi:hypothetical protein